MSAMSLVNTSSQDVVPTRSVCAEAYPANGCGRDESRIHRGALHVLDDFTAIGIQDFMLFADGHNLAVANGHGLRLSPSTIQTNHMGISNHEVNRLFGKLAPKKKQTKDVKVTRSGHEVTLYKWCALACAVGMMTMSLMHT